MVSSAEKASVPVYVVFEGGGAKAIAHVGALQAIQETNTDEMVPTLEIKGVSGTSAGAIVAAFVAAGADARGDLIDQAGSIPLLESRPNQLISEPRLKRLVEIFQPNGWRRIQMVSWLMSNLTTLLLLAIPLCCIWIFNMYVLYQIFVPRPLIITSVVTLFIIVVFAFNDQFKGIPLIRNLIFGSEIFILLEFSTITASFVGIIRTFEQYFNSFVRLNVIPGFIFGALWFLNVFGLIAVCTMLIRRILKGSVTLNGVNAFINHALARKLATNGTQVELRDGKLGVVFDNNRYMQLIERGVRFDDLIIPLKIIAADVISHRIHVWSKSETPDAKVSDAIVASIAIPFLFKPHWTNSSAFVDGGIVSNIPAWAFRRHRTLVPDSHIVALSIAPSSKNLELANWRFNREIERARAGGKLARLIIVIRQFIAYPVTTTTYPMMMFKNIVYTALNGARSLELDATDRLETIELSVECTIQGKRYNVGLLDFDMSHLKAAEIVKKNREHVKKRLNIMFYYRQKVFEDLCDVISDQLYSRSERNGYKREELMSHGGEKPHGRHDDGAQCVPSRGRIRIFLASWNYAVESLKIMRVYNFDDSDIDDRLYLPPDSSLAGLSDKFQRPILASRQHLDGAFGGAANRYRRAVKWRELQWCWAVPFSVVMSGSVNDRKRFVLAVESNITLDKFDRDLEDEANLESNNWIGWFQGIVKDIKFADDDRVVKIQTISKTWREYATILSEEFAT